MYCHQRVCCCFRCSCDGSRIHYDTAIYDEPLSRKIYPTTGHWRVECIILYSGFTLLYLLVRSVLYRFRHWFRWWLVACSALSHYLNKQSCDCPGANEVTMKDMIKSVTSKAQQNTAKGEPMTCIFLGIYMLDSGFKWCVILKSVRNISTQHSIYDNSNDSIHTGSVGSCSRVTVKTRACRCLQILLSKSLLTETEMQSCWWNFRRQWHCKLSFWQLPLQLHGNDNFVMIAFPSHWRLIQHSYQSTNMSFLKAHFWPTYWYNELISDIWVWNLCFMCITTNKRHNGDVICSSWWPKSPVTRLFVVQLIQADIKANFKPGLQVLYEWHPPWASDSSHKGQAMQETFPRHGACVRN